jgi:hypothetical protein
MAKEIKNRQVIAALAQRFREKLKLAKKRSKDERKHQVKQKPAKN